MSLVGNFSGFSAEEVGVGAPRAEGTAPEAAEAGLQTIPTEGFTPLLSFATALRISGDVVTALIHALSGEE